MGSIVGAFTASHSPGITGWPERAAEPQRTAVEGAYGEARRRIEELAPDIQDELRLAMERTARNTGMLFNIALNYGGRAEIVEAARRMMVDGVPPDQVDEPRNRRVQVVNLGN